MCCISQILRVAYHNITTKSDSGSHNILGHIYWWGVISEFHSRTRSIKVMQYVQPILLFLYYSYVKSHLDNDSCLHIYKTIRVICNTPGQTPCVQKGAPNGQSCGVTTASGSLVCCSHLKICSIPKILYGGPSYVD
jgi:hypothetical protein